MFFIIFGTMLKNKKTTQIHFDNRIILPLKDNFVTYFFDKENPILQTIVNISIKEEIENIECVFYRVPIKQLKVFELLKLNKQITLALSNSIKRMVKGTYNYLQDNNCFKTIYIRTHSKFCIIHTKENNFYVILSSANSNSDHKIEQTTIINSKKVYDFHKNFINNSKEEK